MRNNVEEVTLFDDCDDDFVVEVWFDYTPYEPGNYWEPPVLEEYEITQVFLGGLDVYRALTKEELGRIEDILRDKRETYLKEAA